MKAELIEQYAHTWRMFEAIVRAFDEDAWLRAGVGTARPARLALHILQGIRYYIEDASIVAFPSGRPFEGHCGTLPEAELPSRDDVVACGRELCTKAEAWLAGLDLHEENLKFKWAGPTRLGVVLFLLRHTVYHIGELNLLLNETQAGAAEDHWVRTL